MHTVRSIPTVDIRHPSLCSFPAVAHRVYTVQYYQFIGDRLIFLPLSQARRAEINRQYQSPSNQARDVLSVKRQGSEPESCRRQIRMVVMHAVIDPCFVVVEKALSVISYLSFPLSNVLRVRISDRLQHPFWPPYARREGCCATFYLGRIVSLLVALTSS